MSALLSNLLIMPWLPKVMAMKTMCLVTSLLGAALLIVVLLPQAEWSTWLTAGPAAIVTVLTLSACGALLSSQASATRQGAVMGNNQALQVSAEAVAAAVGGVLAGLWIPLPIAACAAALILGALLLLPYRVRTPEEIA